jgi:hypothetical protein
MELIPGAETSTHLIQTLGLYPKENTLHQKHSESLKTKIKSLLQSLTKLSFESSLFSSLGARTFKTMILHQRPLRTTYDVLSLTKSNLFTLDIIL